ncbi:uncharacterized protein RHO25_012230 [Cercospora beticola]|uniref:Uncharacterized protein n=1 Tax=Cercospora beticola TaxID=122368 RepID=A0ABZ0P6Q3_CERBT|nr:hypothetical protein RHO25_012230 [Cercospora beticola]
MAAVVSQIDFLGQHDCSVRGKPYSLRYDPPGDFPRTNFISVSEDVSLTDVRGRESEFHVHKQGFGVLYLNPMMAYEDYEDKHKVETFYFKQVAEGVRELLGASRVQIFEHVLRKRHAEFPIATGEPYKYDQPTTRAHIDMTPAWATAMAEHMNERSGNALPSTRFQFINIWKPLRGPIKDWPLALCDASSLDQSDIEAMDVVHSATVIETYLVRPNKHQRWYYLSDQTEDEAWVFLQADSGVDKHLGIYTTKPRVTDREMLKDSLGAPHSSFRHPDHEQSLFPRESIEVRAIAFYHDT